MKKIAATVLVLIIAGSITFAQEEIEIPVGPRSKFSETYNYVIRAQEEKTQMWKLTPITDIGIGGGSGNRVLKFAPYIGFEKKFSSSFSLNGEVGSNSILSWSKADQSKSGSYTHWLSGSVGPRYYYNINRRIELGKSANNFSANYFSTTINLANPYYFTNLSFSALYGIQRRVGNKGFFDFGAGYMVVPQKNEIEFLPDIRLRYGWGW
jgi:hypothetical protein